MEKLVRDKIPGIIRKSGKNPIVRIANEEEYRKALRKKLLEEAREFEESGNIEEIADILEVIHAILKTEKVGFDEIEKIKAKKSHERGSFKKRIILEINK